MNMSQQGPSTDIDSAGLENGNAEPSPLAMNPPRLRTGKQALRPTTGQALRLSRRKSSIKDGQAQPVACASLGPVHSSKVSKAASKKKPGPRQRPKASQEVFSTGPPLSGPDIAEPLPQPGSAPLRRSKRIQPPEPSMLNDPTEVASVDSLKGIALSRPRQNVAGHLKSIGSAKPQGISKRQHSNTTRWKSRKDDT